MNERIKEIYLNSLDGKQDFCYQKFAELIVRECVRAASTTPDMRKSGAPERIKDVLGVE